MNDGVGIEKIVAGKAITWHELRMESDCKKIYLMVATTSVRKIVWDKLPGVVAIDTSMEVDYRPQVPKVFTFLMLRQHPYIPWREESYPSIVGIISTGDVVYLEESDLNFLTVYEVS